MPCTIFAGAKRLKLEVIRFISLILKFSPHKHALNLLRTRNSCRPVSRLTIEMVIKLRLRKEIFDRRERKFINCDQNPNKYRK